MNFSIIFFDQSSYVKNDHIPPCITVECRLSYYGPHKHNLLCLKLMDKILALNLNTWKIFGNTKGQVLEEKNWERK